MDSQYRNNSIARKLGTTLGKFQWNIVIKSSWYENEAKENKMQKKERNNSNSLGVELK